MNRPQHMAAVFAFVKVARAAARVMCGAAAAAALTAVALGDEYPEAGSHILAASLTGEFEGGQGNYTERLGRAIAVDGDTMIAGAPYNSLVHGINAGLAYVFIRQAGQWVHQAQLVPSVGCEWGHFGAAVAIDGDTAVVGALEAYEGHGSAFVFVRDGETWTERQMLEPSDFSYDNEFGSSVAIDGDTILVGAKNANGTGAAYVFERVGGVWSEIQRIRPSPPSAGDAFGVSVVLSGGTALVGADGDDDGGVDAGTAYVVARVDGGSWIIDQQLLALDSAAGDRFGHSVALDGDTLLVGAYCDDDAGSCSGSSYVFVNDGSAWVEQAKLTASDAAAVDYFGSALSLQGEVAAVGAPYRDSGSHSDSGAVYVYQRMGAVWMEESIVQPPESSAGDVFGEGLTLRGDDLIVGAPGDDLDCANGGSLLTFVRDGETWRHMQRLSGLRNGFEGHFGRSVSASGERVLVGASWDVVRGVREGSASVFVREGSNWRLEARLAASDGDHGEAGFGSSVSIVEDLAVIGAPFDPTPTWETGAAYIFKWDGGVWSEGPELLASDGMGGDEFGCSVWIEGDTIFVGADQNDDLGINSGCVYVFVRDGDDWVQSQKLLASDGEVGDRFGSSVAAFKDTLLVAAASAPASYIFVRDGDLWTEQARLVPSIGWGGDSVALWADTAIIGSPLEDDGCATVFTRQGGTWTETARLTEPTPAYNDRFGYAVALREDLALVTANQVSGYRGAAYLFVYDGVAWTAVQELTAPAPESYDQFGTSAAVGEGLVVVGALEDDNSWGVDAGSVFVFVQLVFMDGFESGDTLAWSATVP